MENYPKKEDKYWVLERKVVLLILFFKYCVVLTWKIVVPPKIRFYPKKEDKYWVLERKIVFLILFFKYCIVLMWKIIQKKKISIGFWREK